MNRNVEVALISSCYIDTLIAQQLTTTLANTTEISEWRKIY